jgi:prepilin-type processing-associated H-X9-DG protein
LVELLVVVAIIILLAAAMFPLMARMSRAAKATTCTSNLRQVGMAVITYASDHGNKLPSLQPPVDERTGKRPPIWPVTVADAGYMWDGEGTLPCGTGTWTCPSSTFVSNAYGGYGVVEGAIFVYGEKYPIDSKERGSLRLHRIERPGSTWLVGDAAQKPDNPKRGWYAIWSKPSRWDGHCPAARHGDKVNICMVDGHVEALTLQQIEERKLTEEVVKQDE